MMKTLFSLLFAMMVASVAVAEECPYREEYATNTVCEVAGQICQYLHPEHDESTPCDCTGDCLCYECVCNGADCDYVQRTAA